MTKIDHSRVASILVWIDARSALEREKSQLPQVQILDCQAFVLFPSLFTLSLFSLLFFFLCLGSNEKNLRPRSYPPEGTTLTSTYLHLHLHSSLTTDAAMNLMTGRMARQRFQLALFSVITLGSDLTRRKTLLS